MLAICFTKVPKQIRRPADLVRSSLRSQGGGVHGGTSSFTGLDRRRKGQASFLPLMNTPPASKKKADSRLTCSEAVLAAGPAFSVAYPAACLACSAAELTTGAAASLAAIAASLAAIAAAVTAVAAPEPRDLRSSVTFGALSGPRLSLSSATAGPLSGLAAVARVLVGCAALSWLVDGVAPVVLRCVLDVAGTPSAPARRRSWSGSESAGVAVDPAPAAVVCAMF